MLGQGFFPCRSSRLVAGSHGPLRGLGLSLSLREKKPCLEELLARSLAGLSWTAATGYRWVSASPARDRRPLNNYSPLAPWSTMSARGVFWFVRRAGRPAARRAQGTLEAKHKPERYSNSCPPRSRGGVRGDLCSESVSTRARRLYAVRARCNYAGLDRCPPTRRQAAYFIQAT